MIIRLSGACVSARISRLVSTASLSSTPGMGGYERLAACADEQTRSLVALASAGNGDACSVAAHNACLAFHNLHARVLHLHLDACHQLAYDFCLAVGHLFVFKGHILGCDAIFFTARSVVVHFCTIEQCLCGNTPLVQTHTSQFSLFKENGLQPFCSCIFGSHVSCGATAKYC